MTILAQVHKTLNPNAVHVVFVHGLGGDARSTWMYDPEDSKTFWPKWIGQDVDCNVWIAGYGAELSSWFDSAMHLADLGEAFFAALQAEQGLKGKQLVLIGHSLGGLVIKSGMTQAQALGDPQRLALLDAVVGVVFIGTPHQGASLATVADKLRILLRTNAQVTNMVNDDAWLKLLNGQFRHLFTQRSFAVRVFFETKGVFLGRRVFGLAIGPRHLIVDRNSSDPGLAAVTPTGLQADHIEIAKPKSRNELSHKALVAFLKDLSENSPPPFAKTGTLAEPINPSALPERLRNASNPLLSWPSTLQDGTWLTRPELDLLRSEISAESRSTHLLLGDPGSGKSSLLVRLAQEKHAEGWAVLAIKADRLPPELTDRDALSKHLNLGTDTHSALATLSKNTPVLLVIDQVDALAELVVQHSARLRVLLDLVQEVSQTDNIHTVISCRTFEQKHDPSLRNLTARPLILELPEWDTILPVLTANGLQGEAWNQDIQQVLRSPHALDIFLSLLEQSTESAALQSFQGLLEKLWETKVLCDGTGRRRETLRHLAKTMADREVLGLPMALVEEHFANIQILAAAGLLHIDQQGPGRVEFRHQTLYEFVRARNFLENSGSLTETVKRQQNSLRIRPQLWHALGYFRRASPEDYSGEIVRLWDADLRPHLKMLIVEFLGLQTVPLVAEQRLVEHALSDEWFLPRFAGAVTGSPGWFAYLAPLHLPKLMSLPDKQAQIVLPLLREAMQFAPNSVIALVGRHWLVNDTRDVLSWQVLADSNVTPTVGSWLDSLVLIAGRTLFSGWAIAHLASIVSAALPEEAPRVIAAWLNKQIMLARESRAHHDHPDDIDIDINGKIQAILEIRQFHEMEAIAEAAPKAFVVHIWPLVNEALNLCESEAPAIVCSYRQSRGLYFEEMDDDNRHERHLLHSVRNGLQGWAVADSEEFLEFAEAHAGSESIILHRLLAAGFVEAASQSPIRVFNYLIADPRRLALGSYADLHKETVCIICALCPLLSEQHFDQLETEILKWNYYTENALRDEDVGVRQRRLQSVRKHRLRLLRALPSVRINSATTRLIHEEERAFPGLSDKDIQFSGVQCIGSPISAEQMEKGSDADLLNFFNELTDDSGWDHPRHRMKGGAIQAGRELAALAKQNLEKSLRIIRTLDPLRNEIPVAATLRELVPAGFPVTSLYSLIVELEEKGFGGEDFRREAAYAIVSAANIQNPVPDELIERLETWLKPHAELPRTDDSEINERKNSSVLWNSGITVSLPGGNYPVLSALTASCMSAEPSRIERWLDIIDQHINRAESLEVWEAMLHRELLNLRAADRTRAESLTDHLIANVPEIVTGHAWAHFIAEAFRWGSPGTVERWIGHTLDQEKAYQIAGELVGLRHALYPAEGWPRSLVSSILTDDLSAMPVGLAHSVAYLWHKPMTRAVVHPLLLSMLKSSNEEILKALSAIFTKGAFEADIETRELLDELARWPGVLKNGRAERLPEILLILVTAEPERVFRVAQALLDVAGEQMGNIATSWYLSTEWLLDIALRLQDMGSKERAAGSALFERMLEFNMPQAKEVTFDLDKRTPAANRPRAPMRRRSRSRLSPALK